MANWKRITIGLSLLLSAASFIGLAVALLSPQTIFRGLIHPIVTAASRPFFRDFPPAPESIVFLGDSITAGAQWAELFPGLPVVNRGISGDRTDDLLLRLDDITRGDPSTIFLLIGTNDLGWGVPHDRILEQYRQLLDRLAVELPSTRVVIQSIMPREKAYEQRVLALNTALRAVAETRGLSYIDLYPVLVNDDGSIRDGLSADGLHLNGEGYRVWRDSIARYMQRSGDGDRAIDESSSTRGHLGAR